MREIPLTNSSLVALVDDEDFDRISANKWMLSVKGYAVRNVYLGKDATTGKYRNSTASMHREVLNLAPDQEGDHRNHRLLDNRKCELRIVTAHQNSFNRRLQKVKYGKKPSRFKGAYWDDNCQKWQSTIRHCYKKIYLGYFELEEDAARAYNEAAKRLFGEFACLNAV